MLTAVLTLERFFCRVHVQAISNFGRLVSNYEGMEGLSDAVGLAAQEAADALMDLIGSITKVDQIIDAPKITDQAPPPPLVDSYCLDLPSGGRSFISYSLFSISLKTSAPACKFKSCLEYSCRHC